MKSFMESSTGHIIWPSINTYFAKVNDKAEKISSGEIYVTNAQNGDAFDPASCPLVIVKSN